MARFTSILALIWFSGVAARSQCITEKDVNGQIVTTCDVYNFGDRYAPGHKKVVYLGTPYLTFPTWLKGTIQVDQGGQTLACYLAYDLVANTVQCKFDSSLTASTITPYSFTIYGMTSPVR